MGSPWNDKWWQEGVTLFSYLSAWIAIPVIAALFLISKLSEHYGESLLMTMGIIGVAFFVTLVGLFRLVKAYIKRLETIEKEEHNGN